jgi:hypothetical protein
MVYVPARRPDSQHDEPVHVVYTDDPTDTGQ